MQELELGTMAVGTPGSGERLGADAEADGYDVALLSDSQNLRGDPYGQLALMARATERVRIGTGVTNPVTRHPAVTAAAIAALHVESGGRAILGIGRGDSALAHIGRGPAPMRTYERYIRAVRTYLDGDAVDQHGFPSRLVWLDRHDLPRVPIDMSCSGPRSIALAAQLADRVTFAVGAAPERLSWAVQMARTAAQEAGRDPDAIRFGAWVNVAIDDDRERAIESLRGGVGTFAHFSGMSDSPTDEQPEILQRVSRTLQSEYDTRRHGEASAPHASHLDDEFIDWFAIAGSPDHVVERLRELVGLGLRHLYFPGALAGGTREPMVATVLPALREHAAAAAGG